MRFEEFIASRRFVSPIFSKTGTNKFIKQQTSQEIRVPHWEMREALQLIETTPEIAAGLGQITRFIIGNEITATSEDKMSQEFLQKWVKQRKSFSNEVEKLVFLGTAIGNAYMERVYITDSNGKKYLDNVFINPDSSRVYINSQSKDDNEDFWLFEVPREAISWRQWSPNMYQINYMYGSYYVRNTIYAVPVPKNHFQHCKIGWSRDGWYGRGLLNAGIDNLKILKEMLNNIEKIVKYRAMNTKIITPASEDMEIVEDDVEAIEQKLLIKKPEDHLVFNKKLDIQPLSNIGEYDTMKEEIEYLRKSGSASLVPNYMTPWIDTTYHNAAESKIPFQLQLDYLKKNFIDFLNEVIITELRKQYTFLAEDLSFAFGNVNLESFETKATYAPQLWSAGAITFNELRKTMGYDTVENGDLFAWEMESKADTMLSQAGGMKRGSKEPPKPMSSSSEPQEPFTEQHWQIPFKQRKPRSRICERCEHYSARKKFCKLNQWPVEPKDGCNRFKINPELEENLREGKVYVRDPSMAPKGATVQTGPKGGKYYDSSGRASEPSDSKDKKEPPQSQPSQKLPDVSQDAEVSGMLMSKPVAETQKYIQQKYKVDEKTASALVVQQAAKQYANFKRVTVMTPEQAQAKYFNQAKVTQAIQDSQAKFKPGDKERYENSLARIKKEGGTLQHYSQPDPKNPKKVIFTPERKAIHDKISKIVFAFSPKQIDKFRNEWKESGSPGLVVDYLMGKIPTDSRKIHQSKNPEVITLGGSPGSGKTTVIQNVIPGIDDRYVTINNDDIKTLLPEYDEWGVAGPAVTHEEAGRLVNRLIKKAKQQRVNFIIDTTLGNKDKYSRILERAKGSGYRTRLLATQLPIDKAIDRATQRYLHPRDGRFVNPEVISKKGSESINSIHQLKSEFDDYMIFDTDVPLGNLPVRMERVK